jgi:Zn-dependent metalloprotease
MHTPVQGILPPHILRRIAERGTDRQRRWANATIALTERFRGLRIAAPLGLLAVSPGQKRRSVYDAQHRAALPGRLVRGEGDPPGKDRAVNQAYQALGATYDFYLQALGRNSIDGKGMRLDASVHFRRDYDNAFWNGSQMVFGDGDGKIFLGFTGSLDVVGHELTHGVTQFEAALEYHDQPGALNESMSDVFGSLVKQYKLGQTAAKADWLIGAGILAPGIHGVALRSMKAPGTAYDDPVLGKDPQPAEMKDYVETSEDDGGVHINSGIPNRAFYLAAIALGGRAWEKAGKIWYQALTGALRSQSDFADAAKATAAAASALFGREARKAVEGAWRGVGVL